MGRSFDQTFYADHYSKIGWGFGHEFRYAAEQPSRGTFRTYVIRTNSDGSPSTTTSTGTRSRCCPASSGRP